MKGTRAIDELNDMIYELEAERDDLRRDRERLVTALRLLCDCIDRAQYGRFSEPNILANLRDAEIDALKLLQEIEHERH